MRLFATFCLLAAARAGPLCDAGDAPPLAAAVNCYAGSFLEAVLTKIKNDDARTSEHQREALLFYLGGDATLQALRTGTQENTSCVACSNSPAFSTILYQSRAALTAAQLSAYDELKLPYPLLTHLIYDELPKSADHVWLRPDAAEPLPQTRAILERALSKLPDSGGGAKPISADPEPLRAVAQVAEAALCDGSLGLSADALVQADRAALLCYAGSFLASLFGKLNSGAVRSSEHVRKSLLLYLMNTDAAIDAASREKMDDKACTLCFTAPTLAAAIDDARRARSDSERRQYSQAAASSGLPPQRLTEMIWARLAKAPDGVLLRADQRFADAPTQAAAVLLSIFADLDAATSGASSSSSTTSAKCDASAPAAGPVVRRRLTLFATAVLLAIAVAVAALVVARVRLGGAGTQQLLQEIMHGAAERSPHAAARSPARRRRRSRDPDDIEEERKIKGKGPDDRMDLTWRAGTLVRHGEVSFATPNTAAALDMATMLPLDAQRSDDASTSSHRPRIRSNEAYVIADENGNYVWAEEPHAPLLSGGVARGLRVLCVLLSASLCLAAGGAVFGGTSGPFYEATHLTRQAPASHIFTHGRDLAAPREYMISMLQLPVGVGELEVAAEQTHEIYWDAATRTAFASVVTSSRLLQLPLDPNAVLAPQVRQWVVGHPEHNAHPELGALHNVAGSHRFPGSLWLSTEGDDRVYLVDPDDGFRVRYAMHVPTRHVDASGTLHKVGGPHSVREAPDGSVWVCLKGASLEEGPVDEAHHQEYLKMMAERFAANGEPVPDGFAVWHIEPEDYNATAFPDKGGTMYDALPSPTMTAIDAFGNTYHTQDKVGSVLYVSADGEAKQVALPMMAATDSQPGWSFANGNGPGIVSDPLGNVWLCNLVPGKPWMVRFAAGSNDPLVFKDLGSGTGDGERHVIHLAFSDKAGRSGDKNVMYALTSALLNPGSTESVIMIELDDKFETAVAYGEIGRNEIVLPTRNSAAHRITVVDSIEPHSVLVTGLLTNSVFQIMGPGI